MSIDIDTLDDEHEQRHDFRRANGAPMVSDPDNPDKTLRYRRPSGYGKVLDDENALVDWRIWKAMQGVAKSKALQAKIGVTRDEDKTEKKALREEAMDRGAANEAADTGTALHAMTARIEDATDIWDPPEAYAADLAAYVATLEEFGLVSEMVEVHMVNDAYRAAGTADRIYRLTKDLVGPDGRVIEAGTLILADIKTGKSLDFSLPGYVVQMALYADGQLYDIHTERRLATPEINGSWTMLVHLPVGKARCELLWCSITLGLQGALLSFDVKQWQKLWKSGAEGHDAFPVLVAEPPEQGSATEPDDPASTILAGMQTFVQERVNQIGANTEARTTLMHNWPDGVPSPKKGITDPGHMVKILDLLDAIEKKYSLPFIPDPRQGAGDKSQTDRSNARQLT